MEKHLIPEPIFWTRFLASLGLISSQKMIFNDITTGASDDLRHAMEIARALVMKYGMSETISPVAWGANRADILEQRLYGGKNYSEEDGLRNRRRNNQNNKQLQKSGRRNLT